MTCLACSHETIVCLTPAGRVIDLEPAHVYLHGSGTLPGGLFILGASGGGRGPAVAHATPVIEYVDRERYTRNGFVGPFRREHACPA